MDIEPDEYMIGKGDAQARLPQRMSSIRYRLGYVDGLAERSVAKTGSIEVTTLDGSKISVVAAAEGVNWLVECAKGNHSGIAIDPETAFAAAEGTLRSLGHSIARRAEIEDSIRRARPGISPNEVERLSKATQDFILSHKGAFAK